MGFKIAMGTLDAGRIGIAGQVSQMRPNPTFGHESVLHTQEFLVDLAR